MWIFQWLRWKYPCSPSMSDLPLPSDLCSRNRQEHIFLFLHICAKFGWKKQTDLKIIGKYYRVFHVMYRDTNRTGSQVSFPCDTNLKVNPSDIFVGFSFTQLPFWRWCFSYSMLVWKCGQWCLLVSWPQFSPRWSPSSERAICWLHTWSTSPRPFYHAVPLLHTRMLFSFPFSPGFTGPNFHVSSK